MSRGITGEVDRSRTYKLLTGITCIKPTILSQFVKLSGSPKMSLPGSFSGYSLSRAVAAIFQDGICGTLQDGFQVALITGSSMLDSTSYDSKPGDNA